MAYNATPKFVTAVPVGFGALRAVTTGTDLRYLVTAVASLAVAATLFRVGASRISSRWLLSSLALVASTLAGSAVAMWQGATSGPAVAVVATSFGVCVTASGMLGLFSRLSNRGDR
jgi:hypothetical protein